MMDLKEVCKVYGKAYPELIPEKYYTALNYCGVFDYEDISWKKVVGTKVYNELVAVQQQKFDEILKEIGADISYYELIYSNTKQVFDYLQPAKIDLVKYKVMMSSNDVAKDSKIILEKWKPNKDSFLDVPTYDIFSSVTGRMKITSGPNALLLPKDLRQILKSRHDRDGALWYIDFVSLEPRVALAIHGYLKSIGAFDHGPATPSSGAQTLSNTSIGSLLYGYPPQLPDLLTLKGNSSIPSIPQDVYSAALKKLKLSNEIDRTILKQIILPQLYGQSKNNTIDTLEKRNIRRPEEVVDMVNEFFGIDDLRQYVLLSAQEHGSKFLRSFYGRHICPDDSRPYALLNYYIQSLAVDVALLGFKKILDRIAKVPNASSLIAPVFFIHDAMVLDVHSSMDNNLASLMEYGSKNMPGFPEHTFNMSATKL